MAALAENGFGGHGLGQRAVPGKALPIAQQDGHAQRLTDADWDAKRDVIEQWWLMENKDLKTLMSLMYIEYGFDATEKQWKRQIKRLGFEKNVKTEEMRKIIQIDRRRSRDEGKETCFMVRARPVPRCKISRFQKRNPPGTFQSPQWPTPDCITYFTPQVPGTVDDDTAEHVDAIDHGMSPVSFSDVLYQDHLNSGETRMLVLASTTDHPGTNYQPSRPSHSLLSEKFHVAQTDDTLSSVLIRDPTAEGSFAATSQVKQVASANSLGMQPEHTKLKHSTPSTCVPHEDDVKLALLLITPNLEAADEAFRAWHAELGATHWDWRVLNFGFGESTRSLFLGLPFIQCLSSAQLPGVVEWALLHDSMEMLAFLISRNFDPDLPADLLHMAVKKNKISAVRLALVQGVPIDHQGRVSRSTAVEEAVKYGHLEIAALLCDKGASQNARFLAFVLAWRMGQAAAMRVLLESGLSLGFCIPALLRYLRQYAHLPSSRLLNKAIAFNSASPELKDASHSFFSTFSAIVAQTDLSHEVALEVALAVAVAYNFLDVAAHLLSMGCDPELPRLALDGSGPLATCLHLAAANTDEESCAMAQLLITYGADTCAHNRRGWTALEIAGAQGNLSMCALLGRNYGAAPSISQLVSLPGVIW